MRKIFLLFVFYYSLFIIHYSFSQSGWIFKNYGGDTRAVCFVDQNTGWVGGLDLLLKTTDGGLTWQPDIVYGHIYTISFVNSNTGFVGGDSILFKTTNRGLNWVLINTGIPPMSYTCFSFANENTGWVASSSYNKILKTTNGGENWFICFNEPVSINSIFFVNELTGWCARNAYQNFKPLLKTTNGGMNWFSQNIDTTKTQFDCLSFADINTGYCNSDNFLYKTTNSGNQWNLINNNVNAIKLKFINSNTGYASCFLSVLKKTTNGGVNFSISDSVYYLISGPIIYDIFFLNQNSGWFVGSTGIIKKTSNGGINWQSQIANYYQPGSDASINRINNNTIWAGIIKSTNRGDSWIGYTTQYFYSLDCSYFINDSTGFINYSWYAYPSYYYEEILRTTNQGINWSSVLFFQSSYNTSFKNIYFLNINTGWAIGTSGIMYKTTNSGNSWASQSSGTTYALRKMTFIDQNTGYCTSDNGSLLKSTNAGDSWSLISSGASGSLYGLFFINNITGWFTGVNGQIFKTTNSGINWTSQNSGTNKTLYNIYFTDNDYGWACGQNGVLLKTLNSGNLWRKDMDNTGSDINNIFFFDHNTGFCYSAYMIMKTTTGGLSWLSNNNNIVPDRFSLSQNYPNPFNPTTNIKFKVASLKVIKLIVYDILGKKIATLVNEKLKPGEYEVTFDAANLPSGIYFYTLSTDDFKETKKMLMIK